jgi:Fibronectin type III-like domain/Glycosyl hydrolase family 3 C-terminal domain
MITIVTAVLWAGLPGQEAGNSITEVIYGDTNPSGRLPYTIAKTRADYGVDVIYQNTSVIEQIPYSEGLLFDYRRFDSRGIQPRYEFGFGLSYTTFDYSNLSIYAIEDYDNNNNDSMTANRQLWESNGYGASVAEWLHEPRYAVEFTVCNSGDVFGHEVAQAYVRHGPGANEPPMLLRAFERVGLDPGEYRRVRVTLSEYALSTWDVVTQRWRQPAGDIGLWVGASSRDIRLKGTIYA